ncbi:MAG: class I SAM-dependent DNA methyltransferase [Pseudomonadota bacterium]
MTRWDGETMKLHPITGDEIPDPDAQMELYRYGNPRRADWPEVEFIVGNPPFIGGKDMRAELGDGYAEAAWKARKGVPGGADFVMHFWDEAATRLLAKPPAKLKGENPLRRFGFITTNSLTQTFSRRVAEKHMNAKLPLSLVYAVPDHPWVKGSERAAVRIAMTVAVRGERLGKLAQVVHESGLNSDTPDVRLESHEGTITSKLTLGVDLSKVKSLQATDEIGHKGFMPYGTAFFITSEQAKSFGLGRIDDAEKYIRPYINGRNLNHRWTGRHTLDFHEKSQDFVRQNFPDAYQHLLNTSKPVRANNKMEYRREHWWRYGQPSVKMRDALAGLSRFIGTAETAAHRIFSNLDKSFAPDQKVRVIALDSFVALSIVSSRLHVWFSFKTGGWQGVGNDPVYQHTNTFDPFPFPILTDAQSAKLNALGERLEAFRKERLAEHEFLTMTDMYNVLEHLRELEAGADVEPLSQKEKDIHEAGLISVLKDIHDEVDREVFAAYGWEDLGKRLVGKPGATTPSPHKREDQEEAEEELLTRLVALNQERAAEEKRGLVRWLRPDFQIPRLGHKVSGSQQVEADLGEVALIEERKWPSDGLEQIRTVRDVLAEAEAPLPAEALSTLFKGRTTAKRKARVAEVLETLVATGAARDGDGGYFLPR